MLNKGDLIPDLILKNQNGEDVFLRRLIGNPFVIYFYPKDDTPGCTLEACSFRDHYSEFKNLGVKVFGISNDSIQSHEKFSKDKQLNFDLLSDKNKKAERAFGVPRSLFGLLPGRVTFIFDGKGMLWKTYNSQTQPTSHIKVALEVLKEL